jgi:hypothetical protein
MSGKAGRSGRPRKPLAHHLVTGSYRPDRHGPLPRNVLPMPAPPAQPWAPDAAALTEMGPSGRAFVRVMVGSYEFSLVEGVLLLEAGHAVAALSAVRAINRTKGSLRELAAVERLELSWQKQLAALLAQLRVITE